MGCSLNKDALNDSELCNLLKSLESHSNSQWQTDNYSECFILNTQGSKNHLCTNKGVINYILRRARDTYVIKK